MSWKNEIQESIKNIGAFLFVAAICGLLVALLYPLGLVTLHFFPGVTDSAFSAGFIAACVFLVILAALALMEFFGGEFRAHISQNKTVGILFLVLPIVCLAGGLYLMTLINQWLR